MYKIGEKVFYPHHGAGEILNIEVREMLGNKRTYYIIRFPLTETTIMVPEDNTQGLGLRSISDHREIKRCFELIASKGNEKDEDWKVRHKKHQEMLKSGSLQEITIVIKNLYVRNRVKELSTTEKKLYNNALKMMISEIALSLDKNQEEVKAEILRMLEDNSQVQ